MPTPDGGILAGGCSHTADGEVEFNRGKTDAWLLKHKSDGSRIEWKRSIGGTGGECIVLLTQAPGIGYLAAGVTESSDGDFVEEPPVQRVRGWAALIGDEGATRWVKTFGNESIEIPIAASAADGGGFLVIGTCNTLLQKCSGCPPVPDGQEGEPMDGLWAKFLITLRLDPDGRTFSSSCRPFPGLFISFGSSVMPDGSNVVAYSAFTSKHSQTSRIVATSPDGTSVSAGPLDPDGKASPTSVSPAAVGGFVGAGNVEGAESLIYPWIFMTGPDGTMLWHTKVEDGWRGNLLASVPTGDGVFAAGSGFDPSRTGKGDLLAVLADAQGKVIWTALAGGSLNDTAYGVAVLQDGGLVAAGETESTDGNLADRPARTDVTFEFKDPAKKPMVVHERDAWLVKFKP
jgi:hypothetical protein